MLGCATVMATAIYLAMTVTAYAWTAKVDGNIRKYIPVAGVSGVLNSTGPDTLNNLMASLAEKFQTIYPGVIIQIKGGGSSTPALIAGTSQIVTMSREMNTSEISRFQATYGYKPSKIGIALDSLVIYVNKDNPIKRLSLEEADAIYSVTRWRGFPEITTWGQLGLTGDLGAMPFSLYGHDSASGTYEYFKEHVLGNGSFKATVKELVGSALIVEAVANNINAIGYSSIGYATSRVRAVPLSTKKGGPVAKANYQNTLEGTYPLARMLYIYVNKKPGNQLPRVVEEFLKFILSQEGQSVVARSGFYPLTSQLNENQLNVLR